jgi:hypothetical protein
LLRWLVLEYLFFVSSPAVPLDVISIYRVVLAAICAFLGNIVFITSSELFQAL